MMEINTKNFNSAQWDLFYKIKNLEFKRDSFKAESAAKFDKGRPFFVSSELGKYTHKLKKLRAGLIDLSCTVENSQGRKKKC